MSPRQRDDRTDSGESGPQGYIGMVCSVASMTIVGVLFGRGLPVWAPAALGAVVGFTCWLAYRAYRSLSRRRGTPSK